MMPTSVRYLCLGGGLASGSAIDELLAQGVPGREILLVCGEPQLPYHRPPLSKGFLAGKEPLDSVFWHPEAFYLEHGVQYLLDTTVTNFIPKERRAFLDSGDEVRFDTALLATGARPRHLAVPGKEFKHVSYLRTLVDSQTIQTAAQGAKQAAIIGAGFIGMEAAATLTSLGLKVTVLHRGDRLFDRFATAEMAQFFHEYFVHQGVDFRFHQTLDHLEGDAGKVTKIITNSGETIPADLVLLGVGVELNLEYLADQRAIGLDNGVVVDEELETAVPGIFAAGDIANFPDPIFGGKRRRIEHWDHAIASGKAAARNMLGKHEPFTHLSYFFSDMFAASFELWGDTDEPDDSLFIGQIDPLELACWYFRGGRVSAYCAIQRSDREKDQAQKLITGQTVISKEELKNQVQERTL